MKFTRYFENEVLRKRSELRIHWVIEAFQFPDRKETQEDGRIRIWKWIDEAQKYLRVILLEDGETIHNAFFDRGFRE
ncbi:hypothetical protein EHQ53_10070 [Leptospira langatensis]|uniref:Uncharacterized protein n=1 Tax=Leptospira langatensis TaxID=2484983 RepID=A0A5F1ZVD0_9LEPT|nr:hypothetical protein EHO57_13125 [Leptospira langatensis]TGL41146.1 hypothetical protein EHQ53_10070 [Leptospira langatensis]